MKNYLLLLTMILWSTLAFPASMSDEILHYQDGTPDELLQKQDVKEYSESFAKYSKVQNTKVAIPEKTKRVSTTFHSKEFALFYLTDSTKVPPGDMKARIVIFKKGQA